MRKLPSVVTTGSMFSLSLIVGSAGGLVAWTLLARYLTFEQVGVVSAVSNTFILLSSITQLNMTAVANRFLPPAGGQSFRLTTGIFGLLTIVGLLGTVAFWYSPLLPDAVHQSGISVAVMIASVILWSFFTLQDHVAAGLGKSSWVPFKNLAYTIAKLVLTIAIASWGIIAALATWWIPLVLSVVVFNLLVYLGPLRKRSGLPGIMPSRRELSGYISGNYAASILTTLLFTGLPVIVVAQAGPSVGGMFSIIWVMIQAIQNIAVYFGSALVISIAQEPARAGEQISSVLRLLLLSAPALVITGVATPIILMLFGEQYAQAGTAPFRVLLAGIFFSAVTALQSSIWRAQKRSLAIVAVSLVQVVPIFLGVYAFGLNDVMSICWMFLASSVASSLACLPSLWKTYANRSAAFAGIDES